jgi:hypothetical protein
MLIYLKLVLQISFLISFTTIQFNFPSFFTSYMKENNDYS